MPLAPTLTADALDRARTAWLAGDPEAWERYTQCLAWLQTHLADVQPADRRAAPPARTARRTDRSPAAR